MKDQVINTKQSVNNLERPKEATDWTKKMNKQFLENGLLDWDDDTDSQMAQRGFIACDNPLSITDDNGNIVFDMEQFKKFLKPGSPAPETVNPSLWRHSILNTYAGLFKMADGMYQVRGYDLALMGIIESDSGYIIVDALSSDEETKKAMNLVYRELGEKPVKAVIITHSHQDHFGGIAGIVNKQDVESGKVKIITGEGFTKSSLTEYALAGPVVGRRSIFQFGFQLPAGPQGAVDSGIGKYRSGGLRSFIPPTDEIKETGESMNIDGVEVVFVVSPETEAPTEIEFYLPQFKTICVAENVNMSMHNLYPLRGTLTRDAKLWSECINELIEMFPEAEMAFGTHFWPVWGKQEVRNWLEKQRDMIKYMHDQTLRLGNLGYNGPEISQMIKLPDSLSSEWFNREYYGSIKHNVRAIYTKYWGWYDGNPANLDPLPPEETATRMVEYMGGAEEVIKKARTAFENGEYRWVAQILNLVVFDDPQNTEARELEADALEQLGYQQECATWRNTYLAGAQELRTGKNVSAFRKTLSFYNGMPEKDLFEMLAVSLNGPKADDIKLDINVIFNDSQNEYGMNLNNSVLHSSKEKLAIDPDITITVDKPSFIKLILLKTPLQEIKETGFLKIEGQQDQLMLFVDLFDDFDGQFNITLP